MFFYPNMLSKFKETDMPSFVWVGIEEIKRFSMSLYKLCGRLSISSTQDDSLLHASDLQFPKPSNDALWNSVGKDEWEANAKEENMVSFADDLRERRLSSHADAMEFFYFWWSSYDRSTHKYIATWLKLTRSFVCDSTAQLSDLYLATHFRVIKVFL